MGRIVVSYHEQLHGRHDFGYEWLDIYILDFLGLKSRLVGVIAAKVRPLIRFGHAIYLYFLIYSLLIY